MSNENVIPFGGRDSEDSFQRKNGVLCAIDKARGVVELVSQMLMGSSDNGLQVDCSCALDLASEELQRLRDEVSALLHI